MKTILISGANRGIGLEFVRQYASEGDRVLACCREPEKAAALHELSQTHWVTVFSLDVNKRASVESLANQLTGKTIDILINNAGIYGKTQAFGALDYANWQEVFNTNTLGPLRLTEALMPQVARGDHGKLIFITSKMGSISDNTSGGAYIYRSSKAALNACVKSIALDLAPRGILAVLLHPGWVKTEMGGPNASISPSESVGQMRCVIANLDPSNAGHFYNFDGKEIPW